MGIQIFENGDLVQLKNEKHYLDMGLKLEISPDMKLRVLEVEFASREYKCNPLLNHPQLLTVRTKGRHCHQISGSYFELAPNGRKREQKLKK